MAIPKLAMAVASSVVSAVGQIQAGKAQARAYQAQAKQAELQGKQQALQYRQQGVNTLRRLRENVSATRARAAGSGLDPFSGTPASFEMYALRLGAEEYTVAQENAVLANEGGVQQAAQYTAAASQARRQGYIGAMGTLGSMGFQVEQAGGWGKVLN
jgi:uncharacterized protein (AIM24 family)